MHEATPRLRADARRNRDRLLGSAATAFAAGGDPTLEAIAQDAKVGIGTLYRHFPTREALVEAVYRAELATLCEGVDTLLDQHAPAEALRAWMNRYADFVTTKRGMANTLQAVITAGTLASSDTRRRIDDAVTTIMAAGTRAGTMRADVDPHDVVTALVGIFLATKGSADRAQLGRLLDLLVAGLRA